LGFSRQATLFGYIGSIVDYEGLEILLEAFACLSDEEQRKSGLLIVGDGPCLAGLKKEAEALGIMDFTHFTGRVPHYEVEEYYSIIDTFVYPRRGLPVCEMVSPIKPFEALCMEKCVIASNVAALMEIIEHGKTGLLHKKDDPQDLAARMSQVIADPALRAALGKDARAWVLAHRDWRHIAAQVVEIYEEISSSFPENRRVANSGF
jgi:glycosyltransferase involved in cell wall biosynthesis